MPRSISPFTLAVAATLLVACRPKTSSVDANGDDTGGAGGDGGDGGDGGGVSSATIADVQQGVFEEGADVQLERVVVTSPLNRAGEGFTIQDQGGGPWSGIYVYEGGAPSVSRGDTVTVEGRVGDYFGETQLSDVAVIASSPGGVVDPAPVTVAEAVTEAYEGVLVTLTDGTVTDDAYDCGPPSGGDCADPGLWEIDGEDGVIVFDRLYEDADWETHIGSLPVTGVMNYRWDRRRIMPRTAGDF